MPVPASSSSQTSIIEIGTQLGAYRIIEQIAVGGFGTVWRATHTLDGRMVAIKVLHPDLVSAEEVVLRFEREAQAIARLQHPNIVALYEHGRLGDGRPYLVTECLDGVDLNTHIAMRGAICPGEILPILEQLCSALSAAHEHGIVHRDVKASNIFLSQQPDGSLRVVLLDFGVAKLLDDAGPALTMSHVLVGSPSCVSPEQIMGLPVTACTDVYALGALVYHMLTGERLFANARPAEVINLHLDVYPPLPSAQGGISPEFDLIVMKALNKSPEDRFASAAAFVDAFRAAVHRSTVSAGAYGAGESALPAVGIHLEICVAPELLADPEDELLDDVESILPRATQYLERMGFRLAWERGQGALFVQPLPTQSTAEAVLRRRAVDAALALFDSLLERPGGDPRVGVRLRVHVDEVRLAPESSTLRGANRITGGALLDVSEWGPSATASGVLASAAVLRALDLQADPLVDSPGVYRIFSP